VTELSDDATNSLFPRVFKGNFVGASFHSWVDRTTPNLELGGLKNMLLRFETREFRKRQDGRKQGCRNGL